MRRPPARLAAGLALAAAAAVAVLPGAVSGTASGRVASQAGAPASPRIAACPAVPGARPLPPAERVIGRALDAAPLSADETDAYLRALDAASPRIVTGVAGRSVRGRPLRYALLGDPRDLSPARLRAVSAALRALRGGALSGRAVDRAAAGPAVVWIGAGVHANEPSGPTASLALLRRLGTDDSCATRRTLAGVLAVVVPDQNPDGRDAGGTRTNAADIDLNRDWYAASQPETAGRLRLLTRFPPALALDVHEQSGDRYFVPPYARPVVAGLPAGTRRIADGPVSAAIGRALARQGATVSHRGYDLLFPGYADSATSLLFGAGGMTLEQGSDPPLAEKARRHETALGAALATVAADRERTVRAWAEGFRVAVRDGRAGRGSTGDRTFGWTLGTSEHAADALAVAERLRRQGVRVRVLARATRLRVDPLGPDPAAVRLLPAGTVVVPAGQPLARWADVLLGHDADEAGAASSGADGWSVPRAAGVAAGVLRAAVPAGALRRFAGPRALAAADGATVSFPGDSAAAARLALAALAAGRPVARDPDGTLRTTAERGWLRAAADAGLTVRTGGAAPRGAGALRPPRVVAPPDPSPPLVGPPAQLPALDRPAGWVTDALDSGAAAPTRLAPASLDIGVPPGTTHLVLGPAPLSSTGPSPAARAAVERFVRAGGVVLAIGADGVRAAAGLGVSGVRTEGTDGRAAVAVRALPGPDPIGRALGGPTSVVVAGEPLLRAPAGAAVPLRAGAGSALAPSGAAGAGTALAGRPLVIDERLGSGHVLTLGFSPAFRRQSAGGEHVLLSLLLGR